MLFKVAAAAASAGVLYTAHTTQQHLSRMRIPLDHPVPEDMVRYDYMVTRLIYNTHRGAVGCSVRYSRCQPFVRSQRSFFVSFLGYELQWKPPTRIRLPTATPPDLWCVNYIVMHTPTIVDDEGIPYRRCLRPGLSSERRHRNTILTAWNRPSFVYGL
jgi:hypothetical protein